MKVRIVDYVCSPGGGLRFVTELASALHALRPAWTWELVSHGDALRRYAEAFAGRPALAVRDLAPVRAPRPVERVAGIPGTGRLRKALAGVAGRPYVWAWEVPPGAAADGDVAWFPWVHRHRVAGLRTPAVGTFHDATLLQIPGLIAPAERAEERALTRDWIESPARLATGSRATRDATASLFGVASDRFTVIPPAYTHALGGGAAAALPPGWGWARGPFLLYAANTFPHKNHEVLFRAHAAWGRRAPLALSGAGTDDIAAGKGARGRRLRKLADSLGLRMGRDLLPLGYVSDAVLAALTRAAWGAVMPTLAEGGGSFPAQEALLAGVPLVCSDIPVLREQFEGTGAPVLWFGPRDPQALAARLRELERDHGAIRDRVRAAGPALRRRSWADAAAAYAALIERAFSKTSDRADSSDPARPVERTDVSLTPPPPPVSPAPP